MAGRVSGLGKIKKSIGSKKLVVFATGATTKDAKEVIEQIRKDNFTEEERERIPFFYFESGINYEGMGFFLKKLLKMMYNSLKKKASRTLEEQGMMEALSASNDHSNQKYIQPLIDKVKEMEVYIR